MLELVGYGILMLFVQALVLTLGVMVGIAVGLILVLTILACAARIVGLFKRK
jgi:hypothetical protein